jgi:hypothetical protein
MKQYVQTDLDADREVANTLADLILGGLLLTSEIDGQGDAADPTRALGERDVYKSVYKSHAKGRFPVREPALSLVAGVGFEPTTSGL